MNSPPSEGKTAFSVATKFLAQAEKFESEVRKKLEEFSEGEVESVISKLKAQNILNDRRVAESYLKSKDGRRAVGSHRLEYDLRRKGAPEEIISEIGALGGEEERAMALLISKYAPNPELKPKAFRFLVSRGFDFEVARNAIRDFFSADV